MRIKCSKFLSGIVVAFICFTTCFSQPDSTNNEAAACLRLIYNCAFDSARLHYSNFPSTSSDTKNLLELFAMRWENIPMANNPKKEIYLNALTALVNNFKEGEDITEGNLFLHITSQLLLSEYYYTNGEAGKALWQGKSAYPLIMKVLDENKKEPELLFVRAMYLYYMDFFRNKSFMYRAALFPLRDGDMELGLKLLQEAANTQSLAQTEALIYTAHILLHFEKKPEQALPYSKKLAEKYPANLKFRELLIDNLIALKYFYEADAELGKQLETKSAYFKIPALYFAGCLEIEFRKNKEQATKLFQHCIDLSLETGLLEDYQLKAKEQLKSLE